MKKKERELAILQSFKKSCAWFPTGKIQATENPDFVIELADSILGIELTEIYHDSPDTRNPSQEQEALHRLVITEISRQHQLRGDAPITVDVSFNKAYRFSEKDVTNLASEILDFVTPFLPETGDQCVIDSDDETFENFPECLSNMHAARFPFLKSISWTESGAKIGQELQSLSLQEIIDRKNKRCSFYRERCSSAWLVLVTDIGMSSFFLIPDETRSHSFESKFDRVFLYRLFGRRVYELQTKRI